MFQEEYERELRVLMEKNTKPVRSLSLIDAITNDLTVTWFCWKWKVLKIIGYEVQIIHVCEKGCCRVVSSSDIGSFSRSACAKPINEIPNVAHPVRDVAF